jgi:hypothetical protein
MSHVSRGHLIDRWLGLEIPPSSDGFSRRVEEAERLVETIIGKNTLPSLPFVVLAILEASQRDGDVLPENGSFGYLYEVLITTSLGMSRTAKPQLEKKYTFLSLLAFRMFETDSDTITASAMEKLLDQYSIDYRINVDNNALWVDLEYARVVGKEDGNYAFTYTHFFHYFLARYLKNNIGGTKGPELRKRLEQIAVGINIHSNRTFLMFFIYLTHDEHLTDFLIGVSSRALAEVAESTLTSEVAFYNSKSPPKARSTGHTRGPKPRRESAQASEKRGSAAQDPYIPGR